MVTAMDEQQRESWERSMATLERADEALERCEQTRAVAAARDARGWPVVEGPARLQVPQPAPEPRERPQDWRQPRRDWAAEATWVRSICDQQIATHCDVMTEAVGEVIGRERKDNKSAAEALAAEVAADMNVMETRIAELERTVEKLRENRDNALQASLARMNQLLDRIDRTGRDMRKLDDVDPLAALPH
jgi:hypothetical protein